MASGNGNGATWLGPRLTTSHETTTFKIGGVDIAVPALNLFVMQQIKDDLLNLGPDLDWITYAVSVIHVVYAALKDAHPEMEMSETDLLKACSLAEMRELPGKMNELLEISGFQSPEEPAVGVETESPSPGIGTSTASSPNLPSTEFAAETGTPSGEPTL